MKRLLEVDGMRSRPRFSQGSQQRIDGFRRPGGRRRRLRQPVQAPAQHPVFQAACTASSAATGTAAPAARLPPGGRRLVLFRRRRRGRRLVVNGHDAHYLARRRCGPEDQHRRQDRGDRRAGGRGRRQNHGRAADALPALKRRRSRSMAGDDGRRAARAAATSFSPGSMGSAWHAQPFPQRGQSLEISPMGGAGRDAGQPADLLERKAAPEVGDHDLALLQGQRFQRGGRGLAVQRGMFGRCEPRRPVGGGVHLVAASAASGAGGARARLAHHLEQPGGGVVRRRPPGGQLDERLLHDVLGAAHHWRANSVSAAACSSTSRPSNSGVITRIDAGRRKSSRGQNKKGHCGRRGDRNRLNASAAGDSCSPRRTRMPEWIGRIILQARRPIRRPRIHGTAAGRQRHTDSPAPPPPSAP